MGLHCCIIASSLIVYWLTASKSIVWMNGLCGKFRAYLTKTFLHLSTELTFWKLWISAKFCRNLFSCICRSINCASFKFYGWGPRGLFNETFTFINYSQIFVNYRIFPIHVEITSPNLAVNNRLTESEALVEKAPRKRQSKVEHFFSPLQDSSVLHS